ncbi:hypothetical protein [Amycolatopsis minnesotensis]|uniref:DUF2510 domain-containing protein n=1 Tax=Amycolatopsis minnesotensis TaxID=337894 RepID=A0ABP5CAJ9_9PSEU
MNLVETILVFALIPLAIYALAGVLTLRSKGKSAQRYRPGQPWEYEPMWWSANPDGLGDAARPSSDGGATAVSGTAAGGARGNW